MPSRCHPRTPSPPLCLGRHRRRHARLPSRCRRRTPSPPPCLARQRRHGRRTISAPRPRAIALPPPRALSAAVSSHATAAEALTPIPPPSRRHTTITAATARMPSRYQHRPLPAPPFPPMPTPATARTPTSAPRPHAIALPAPPAPSAAAISPAPHHRRYSEANQPPRAISADLGPTAFRYWFHGSARCHQSKIGGPGTDCGGRTKYGFWRSAGVGVELVRAGRRASPARRCRRRRGCSASRPRRPRRRRPESAGRRAGRPGSRR
jgi:hypothetical protein